LIASMPRVSAEEVGVERSSPAGRHSRPRVRVSLTISPLRVEDGIRWLAVAHLFDQPLEARVRSSAAAIDASSLAPTDSMRIDWRFSCSI
jgi:hypothetical protein